MEQEITAVLGKGTGGFDGIFAASDLIAMSCLRMLHANGASVPEDVQLVGFDDLSFAAQTSPPLTTVHQDINEGARAMVEKLKARIDGRDAESLIMPPRLIVRKTTRTA